jgi:RNA polymerase sigma-54 factor
MKPALSLRASLSLALTPQLQLAIRVLRMSADELTKEIQEALESNPMLALDEGSDEPGEATSGLGEASVDERGDEPDLAEETQETDFDPDETGVLESPADADRWDEPGLRRDAVEADDREPAATVDLKRHVWAQVECLPLDGPERAIAAALVDALDDDGYVREDLASLRQAIGIPGIDDARIESVRRRLMSLDPTGVAARDLAECLLAQLDEVDPTTPGLALARRLVASDLEALAAPPERLAARIGVSLEECQAARRLVASLDPKPGAAFTDARASQVVPDLEVQREKGRWRVRLTSGTVPRLRLDRAYAALARAGTSGADAWIRGRLQEARWLIRSLEQREETLLRVAGAVVDHQNAFFDFGPSAMRPLSMREIADRLGLHESTVSRAVAHKYIATPRGVFELRRFFPTGLATTSGGRTSSTAIQALIRQLIDAEPRAQPLSDQAIADRLSEQGIRVARRTVAKYRELLGIAPSHERGGNPP